MIRKTAPKLAWDATPPVDSRPTPKKKRLFFVYIARVFGFAPFTINRDGHTSMSLSNHWLIYSCLVNVVLFFSFFIGTRLFYISRGCKLTKVVLPIVRGSVMILSQIACLIKRSDIVYCIQNIRSRTTTPPKTKYIIVIFGVSVLIMFIVNLMHLVVSDFTLTWTPKSATARAILIMPIFIAQLAVFIFSYTSNILQDDLTKMRLDIELIRYSSRTQDLDIVYGLSQRYLKIALFKERLENALSHQILLIVFLLFVHCIGYLHFAVTIARDRYLLTSLSILCFSMLWIIFHSGSNVVSEAERMAVALSATLARPGLPQAVRKEGIAAIATYLVTLLQTSKPYVTDVVLATAAEAATAALAAFRNTTQGCCSSDSCVS